MKLCIFQKRFLFPFQILFLPKSSLIFSSVFIQNLSTNKLKFHAQTSAKRQILGIFQKSCFIVSGNIANIESIKKFALQNKGDFMTNEKAIKALEQMKTYVSANSLDELDYAIEVLKKLEKDGVKNPLETDFSKAGK